MNFRSTLRYACFLLLILSLPLIVSSEPAADETITTPSRVSAYTIDNPTQLRGYFPGGAE